jgi:hypothetical protein
MRESMRDVLCEGRRSLDDTELLAVIDAGWPEPTGVSAPEAQRPKSDKRRKKRGRPNLRSDPGSRAPTG